MTAREAGQVAVYVGTYASGGGQGIYLFRFDASSGTLSGGSLIARNDNPSFLAFHPQGRFLYAVNEGEVGAMSAFAIDPQTRALTPLNRQPTGGADPCYVSVDASGRYAMAANYSSGSLAILPIEADGHLGEMSDHVQHHGSSVNPQRQEGPHAHCILPDPGNRYVLAADLGLDRVMIYQLDLQRGKLVPNREPWLQVRPGAGPRHLAFHPNRRIVYLIDELDSTLSALAYDAAQGTLRELQTVSTLPPGFAGENTAADVHVHPSGAFVYGSNRGHDSIAIFAVDQETGRVTPAGHEPTRGRTPRNFCLDPTGAFLLAANQESDSIVTFRIDQKTGGLTPTGAVAEVPAPVCVLMAAV